MCNKHLSTAVRERLLAGWIILAGMFCSAPLYAASTLILPESSGGITIDADGSCTEGAPGAWPGAPTDGYYVAIDTGASTAPRGEGGIVIHHAAFSFEGAGDDPTLSGDDELYFYLKVTDNTTSAGTNPDNVVLMFDTQNDGSFKKGLRFERSGEVHYVTTDPVSPVIVNTGDNLNSGVSASRYCITQSSGTQWVIEAAIHASDIGLTHFNSLMRAIVRTVDVDGFGSSATWPGTVSASDPATWNSLITRAPIDFMLLADESGSMYGDKWKSVKDAGNYFVAILKLLQDSDLNTKFNDILTAGGDRIGLSSFTTSKPLGVDPYPGLSSITTAAVNYTNALPANPGGSTPMAEGVNKTIAKFVNNPALTLASSPNLSADDPTKSGPALHIVRQKVVMMLSDGMHNYPRSTLDFDNPHVDFVYLPNNCLSTGGSDSLVRVNTVAIGEPGTVDESKLSQIKTCFGGRKASNIYNLVENSATLTGELTRNYLESVFPYFRLNQLNLDTTHTNDSVTVQAGDSNLIIFASWADASGTEAMTVTDPASNPVTVHCEDALGYCYAKVAKVTSSGTYSYNASGAANVFALVDLRLGAEFAMDNQPHGTSSTITLRARLREDGVPVTGATVKVDIVKPTEGFGTVASTTDPQSCKKITPQLPVRIDPPGMYPTGTSMRAMTMPTAPVAAGNATTGAGSSTSNPGAADVKPPAFALMQSILDACHKSALTQGADNGLTLYDDGTHGDITANDGVYTLVYENTTIEGSYIFNFRATGTSPNGQVFKRTEKFGEYVRLDVDPSTTTSGNQILSTAGNIVTALYYVTPRDIHLGYLGPGHIDQVKFSVNGALAQSSVIDYNNGIYAIAVKYDKSKGTPSVTPVVQGTPVVTVTPCHIPGWIWWLLLILIALVLLLLLLCILRRK
ncbi:MAG: hypothetical protein GC149_14135 [Gammaproteobacteria bacterium]|nr:hypothetical protein [Gammaproteobacteria bacterium]